MSRMALWNMYNNSSPHNQHNNSNPSPPEVQQEALNLQRESPSPIPSAIPSSPISIKRERDHSNEVNDYHVPPAKRGLIRTNSDLTTSRKTSIINNNNHHNNHHHHHHHINNNNNNNDNNQHMTPTKDMSSNKRSESPQNVSENGNHQDNHHHHDNLQSPMRHQKQNGFDSLGSTFSHGMQFKIISKGKKKLNFYEFLKK